MFGAINDETQPDLTIRVPAAYGALRFWRHTDVATLAPGATIAHPGHAGLRVGRRPRGRSQPAGLIELTSTTETVPAVLTDHGGSYTRGPPPTG